MMNAVQQMLAQQGLQGFMGNDKIVPKPTSEAEWLVHQEPVASAMKSLMKILEYEKKILAPEEFAQMVDSLKINLNAALDKVKVPNIPQMGDIVSINGEPAVPVSGS